MRRYLLLGVALVAAGSCSPSGSDGGGPSAAVALVTVTPALDTVYIGAVSQLAAVTKDVDGNVLAGRSVTWSKTGTGATVSSTGLVTGTATGDLTVTATSEGIGGNATIFVRPVPVVSVLLTPATDTIYQGATAQLTATPRDSIGGTLAGRVTNWSSLDAAASVNNAGLVTSLSLGTARIVANVEGKADTTVVSVLTVPVATVVVTPATDTLYPTNTSQLAAVTRDSASNILAGRVVAWSSLDAAASVNGTGLVTANSIGTARIVGTSEGKADTTLITVAAVPVASVLLTPAGDTMPVGEGKQFVAATRDSVGGALAGRVVSWSSTASLIASVSASGLVIALDTGTTSVIATSEGKSDTAFVRVTLRPVGSVIITPASDTLQVGDSAQFTAAVLDTTGAPLVGRSVTWSSLDTTASVTAGGQVHALVVGTARIVAAREGKADTALIAITAVALPPLTGTWLANAVSSLDGPAIVVPYLVQTDSTLIGTWYSPGPDHDWGTLDGSVLGDSVEIIFRNAGPGCDQVWTSHRVGADSLNGSFIFIGGSCLHPTNNGPISAHRDISTAQVVIVGAPDSLTLGDSLQFAAEARDSANGVIAGRPVRWTSSDTTVVRIASGGLAHAAGLGTALLVAEGQGRADTVTITVAAVPVASVVVTSPSDTLYPLHSMLLAVATYDSIGGVLTGRAVAWSSLDSLAVTFGAGLVTAHFVGTARIVATSEGKADTALITIVPAPVASLDLAPDSVHLSAGAKAQFAATLRDSGGVALPNRVVAWTALDTTVATVSTSGLVTGVAAGATSLIALSEGKGDTALVVVDSLATPLTSLTGDWTGFIYDSLSAGGGPITMTVFQNDTALTATWEGPGGDTGTMTGTVHGAVVELVIHGINRPGGDCEASWSAGRFGSDSLLGRYEFLPGCISGPQYGSLSFHRGSPPGPSEFDIAASPFRESGEASASDGTNVLIGYHQADASGPTSPSNVRFVLLDPSGTAISSVVETGQTGNEPAVAFGGGGYFAIYARHDSSVADLTGLFINSSGVAVGSPFSIKVGARGCGLAYAGGTFGILYADANLPDSLTQIYFRRISTGGTIGPEVVVASAPATCNRTVGPLASDGSGFLAIIDRPDGTAIRTRTISVADALGAMNTIATAAGGGLIFSEVTPISGGWAAVWNNFFTATNSQSQYAVLAGDGSGSSLGTVGETGGTDAIVAALRSSGTGFALAWLERPADPSQSVARFRRFDSSGAPVGSAITIATTQGGKFPLPLTMEPFGASFLVVINRYDLGSSIGDWDPETGDVSGIVITP